MTDASRWLLNSERDGTAVILEWDPRVEKPLVEFPSPIIKPVFRWNHDWMMQRGEVQITEYSKEKTRAR